MELPWRGRRSSSETKLQVSVPSDFRCPISLELMRDPVTAATGITYDRQSIEAWLAMGGATCPVTNQDTASEHLVPNHALRKLIQDWCVANRSRGVERIPTPKIPVTSAQAAEVLAEIAAASRRGDDAECERLVARVRSWAEESERNRLCILSSGSSAVLAAALRAFIPGARVLEEIVEALAMFLPLDGEAASLAGSPESLRCLASILNRGGLAARVDAAMLLRELATSPEGGRAEAIAATEDLVEALARLVKEPVSARATKASLVALYYLVNADEMAASRAVGEGLVPALVEALVGAERSMSEKALAVLDGLLGCERGREEALGHALTVPVLMKKMFRVSDMATEFVVASLWKLCGRNGGGEERRRRKRWIMEVLQAGAFQKLLLLLQVGCSEATKERATNLLKLLNTYRERYECVDSGDFKGVKKHLLV